MPDTKDAHRLVASIATDLNLTDANFATFLCALSVGIPLDAGFPCLDPQVVVLDIARSLAKAMMYALCSCGQVSYEPWDHASGCEYGRLGGVVREAGERLV